MSKNYNLWNWAAASALAQAPASSPDPEWHLYSDVATSRSPSLLWDREYPSARASDTGTQALGVASTMGVSNDTKYIFPLTAVNCEINEETSKEQESGLPWQTINWWCACSLDSAEIAHKGTGQRGQNPKRETPAATTKLSNIGLTATKMMGQPEAAQPRGDTLVEFHCEGPSQPKNDSPDPRDWGNVQLDKNKMDVVLQQAAYKFYKEQGQYKSQRKKCEHFRMATREWGPSQRWTRPPECHPVAQIAPDRFLEVALRNPEWQGDPSDDPALSSSSLSERDLDKSPSKTSSYSSRSTRPQHQCRRHWSRSKARKGKSDLKLIPPKIYDGSANAWVYHQFMRESESYPQDGRVWGTWQKVFTLSHFLVGKAYDFYTQKVAINEQDWPMPCFFKELFDYCFPIDFKMQTRKKLACCSQGEHTITEYSHELQELFKMIETVSEQDQVLWFWNGVKPEIQSGLWRAHLNLEISSWDEVLAQAKIIEISENVAHQCENWSRITKQDGPFIPRTSIPRFQPSSLNLWASRSMTFESRRRKTREARTAMPTHLTRASTRSLRTHQSGSTRPVPEQTSYNDQVSQVTARCQVKTEPQNDLPVPPVLSEKEKAELVGKCYLCKELGHMAQNCPQGNKLKSSTGKLPGTSNFNIEFDKEVNILENLPLNWGWTAEWWRKLVTNVTWNWGLLCYDGRVHLDHPTALPRGWTIPPYWATIWALWYFPKHLKALWDCWPVNWIYYQSCKVSPVQPSFRYTGLVCVQVHPCTESSKRTGHTLPDGDSSRLCCDQTTHQHHWDPFSLCQSWARSRIAVLRPSKGHQQYWIYSQGPGFWPSDPNLKAMVGRTHLWPCTVVPAILGVWTLLLWETWSQTARAV